MGRLERQARRVDIPASASAWATAAGVAELLRATAGMDSVTADDVRAIHGTAEAGRYPPAVRGTTQAHRSLSCLRLPRLQASVRHIQRGIAQRRSVTAADETHRLFHHAGIHRLRRIDDREARRFCA